MSWTAAQKTVGGKASQEKRTLNSWLNNKDSSHVTFWSRSPSRRAEGGKPGREGGVRAGGQEPRRAMLSRYAGAPWGVVTMGVTGSERRLRKLALATMQTRS